MITALHTVCWGCFDVKQRVQNLLVITDLDSEISHCCIASVGHATLSQSVLDKQISSFNIIAFLSLIKFHCTHNPLLVG